MRKFRGLGHLWGRFKNASSLTRGIARLTGGVAVAQLVTLAAYPVLTRIYDAEAFGVLSVYTAIVGLVVMVSTLRYDMAVPLPDTKQDALAVVAFSLWANFWVTLAFVGVGIFFPSLLGLLGQGEIPSYFIWLIPAGIWLGGTYKTMRMWAVRERAYGVIATTQVSQTLGTSVLQLGMGLLHPLGVTLVSGQMLGSGIGIGSIYTRTIRGRALRVPRLRETLAAGRKYWRFAAMGAPSALLNSVAVNMPSLLIASFYGTAVTGQFGLAMRVIGVPITLLGNSVESTFYAEAARLGRNQARQIREMVDRLTIRLAGIGIVPALVLVFSAPVLFEFVFGPSWREAGVFASYLSVYMFFNMLSMPFSSVFLIFERLHLSLLLNCAKALLAVGAFVVPNTLGWTASQALLTYALSLASFYLVFGLTARRVLQSQSRRQTDLLSDTKGGEEA